MRNAEMRFVGNAVLECGMGLPPPLGEVGRGSGRVGYPFYKNVQSKLIKSKGNQRPEVT